MTTIFGFLADLFAQALVILYPPVLVFWLIIHTRIERWRHMGKSAYWIAAAAWSAISLPLLYFRRILFAERLPNPWWMILIGLAAFSVAATFATRASRVIPLRTVLGMSELEPEKRPQPLLQSGVYARTRNPIYFSHWLFVVAGAALTGFLASWVFLAVETALLPIMTRAEERELLSRYGEEYRRYMARVPRFFPKTQWTRDNGR